VYSLLFLSKTAEHKNRTLGHPVVAAAALR
jgi:hypothetical protein